MNHQPFELWLFDDDELNVSETHRLQQHLEECDQCRQLKNNWEEVRNAFNDLPIAAPSEGFGQRWRLSVEARREMKQRSQLWKFFLIISSGVFVTLVVLACQVFNAGSPMNWLAFVVQNGVNIIANLVSVMVVFISWVDVMPASVSLILWLVAVGLLLAITFGFVFAVRRFTSRRRTFLE